MASLADPRFWRVRRVWRVRGFGEVGEVGVFGDFGDVGQFACVVDRKLLAVRGGFATKVACIPIRMCHSWQVYHPEEAVSGRSSRGS